jgi:hypothetical protein
MIFALSGQREVPACWPAWALIYVRKRCGSSLIDILSIAALSCMALITRPPPSPSPLPCLSSTSLPLYSIRLLWVCFLLQYPLPSMPFRPLPSVPTSLMYMYTVVTFHFLPPKKYVKILEEKAICRHHRKTPMSSACPRRQAVDSCCSIRVFFVDGSL